VGHQATLGAPQLSERQLAVLMVVNRNATITIAAMTAGLALGCIIAYTMVFPSQFETRVRTLRSCLATLPGSDAHFETLTRTSQAARRMSALLDQEHSCLIKAGFVN